MKKITYTMDAKEKVVVIGGGFAGINFVKRLDRRRYDVTLVDRNNFHSFPPLFYQVAASGLEPASISFPFRREMRKMTPGGTYHMGDVKAIDIAGKKVVTQYETLHYDKLVIAAGSTNNFFGIPDL
ncbi:MAG: FAD-dependent oxidoreductase, partial [Muribaculum sp.]|nr:FAD-dependent oxidoreductase [Muribaculum sp.]